MALRHFAVKNSLGFIALTEVGMAEKIGKDRALDIARQHISPLVGASNEWYFFMPEDKSNLSGPKVKIVEPSYRQAMERRKRCVSATALILMGFCKVRATLFAFQSKLPSSRQIVTAFIEQQSVSSQSDDNPTA